MKHCATCNCADDAIPPRPSTSSEWARRQAREALDQALRAAKERRGHGASEGDPSL